MKVLKVLPMKTLPIFDFDGTLVNTKVAVEAAYALALDDPHFTIDTVWGLPWQKWCSPEAKKKKEKLYPACVEKFADLTWLGEHIDWTRVAILTAATQRSVMEVIEILIGPNVRPQIIATECTPDLKQAHLSLFTLHQPQERFLYLDDRFNNGLLATERTRFEFWQVKEHQARLVKQTREKEPWISLSSLLEQTNVFVA